MTAPEEKRPKVGVGVVIHDGAGNIVMGERAGSHGAGTMQCPGGHLEYGESFAECAAREALEETGLEVGDVKFLVATNDVMEEGKHYVTVFVTCVIVGEKKAPEPLEPEKCARWDWVPWSQMWKWGKQQAEAEAQGNKVEKKMFLPLVNLYRDYPDFEFCLKDR
ncbi:nudix domain-containing protein [Amniculicola lignicola CBS 123094]|uniref:Nudix domain-containing protein n=1 Tax=Amniculicola lignicola CBS 123094 TaxID=1392246 RepID=A0A6A5WLH2_9PLEO|nr:nudix domain-containing protein [Amniculicola lignicola CBS 123094]